MLHDLTMVNTPTIVACPTCRKTIRLDKSNPFRPFCGERCKLIDLGAWASEEYKVPAEGMIISSDHEQEEKE